MRSKIAVLIVSLLFAGNTFAGLTTSWIDTANASGNDKVGYLSDASLSVSVEYADGTEFNTNTINNNGWYGDEDSITHVLHLKKDKEININLQWSNSAYLGYETDLLLWDGDGTESREDAKFEQDFLSEKNGNKDFSLSFTLSTLSIDGPDTGFWIFINNHATSFTTTNDYFDLFAQLNANFICNDSADNKKLGIGFRLDFSELTPAPEPTPAVPAPGAILLSGFGTAIVGRMRRRMN